MKLTNFLVDKFGSDKLLHFLVTSWLVSEAKFFGTIPMIFILVIILGFIKEFILDEKFDLHDIIASSFLGGLISVILYMIK